ncbi:MAG: thioredoxin family protein [Bacteroidota bacterium]
MQAQALTIIDQDLNEAQNVAKAEGKLLLIDFYTTWCGPCRVFTAEVHDNEDFAAAISQDYVMLKYDAENDNHGLTAKYHIQAYPTFAVLTADMRLVHKTMGYGDTGSFIEFLEEGKNTADAGKYIPGVSQQIDLDFPEIYIKTINSREPATPEDVAAYWAGVEDMTAEVPFALISMRMYTEEVLDYYVENLDTYRELYGELDANGVVEGVVMQDLFMAIRLVDEEAWEAARTKTVDMLGEEGAADLLEWVTPRWYTASGEWGQFADYVDGLIEADPEAYSMINDMSWQVYEDCEDQSVIERAIEWMRPVIENDPDFMTLDTYAWLFFKNEQYDQAERYISMAIEAGNEEGTDVSASESMLPLLEEARKND